MKAEVRRYVFLSAVWAFLSLFWLYAVIGYEHTVWSPYSFLLGASSMVFLSFARRAYEKNREN